MLSRSLRTTLVCRTGAVFVQQQRNATILKRTYTPPPLSPYATKYQINQSVFADNKYRRYDIEVEDDEAETMEAPIKVILLKTMEEYGKRGQIMSVPRHLALKDLLLPRMAVYASPENLSLYKDITIPEDSIQYSSEIIRKAIPRLSRLSIPVLMSRNHPWTLEPWHVRASMRKVGLEVAVANSIKLPDRPISGPNEDLEAKEFPISLTINDFETVSMRCVLFHWSPDEDGVEECPPAGWNVRFYEPVFESDKQFLRSLPREKLDRASLTYLKDKHEIGRKYEKWAAEREKMLAAS